MLELKPLTHGQCLSVVDWRNEDISLLRTPFFLTREMQSEFYQNVVCDRKSNHRFFAIFNDYEFVGMGGITNIEWENSIGEISIILSPQSRGKGVGRQAVLALIDMAHNKLNLKTLFGECYFCSPYYDFWLKICNELSAPKTTLKNRKYWDGEYYDSLYFSFIK